MATDVSQFELIFKPQSPVGPADTVLQGYFLNITNLEEEELFFRLDFVTSSVSDPDRSLANNTIAIIDTPSQNNVTASLVGGLTSASFRLSPNVTIPAGGTAKVVVLPSDPFPEPMGAANFEARGYVTIRLPARTVQPAPGTIQFERQIEGAAKVLLTPQNRATYFDTEGAVSDQTQSSVPTANGAGLVEVPSERFGFLELEVPGFLDRLSRIDPGLLDGLGLAEFATLMAAMPDDDATLARINEKLAEAGIGMGLTRQKAAGAA